MCTKSQLEAIEEEMVNYYRSVYGDSIDTIILYGSYARGDYSDDSDIDITAIVRGNRVELQKKLKKMWDFSTEVGLAYDVIVSPTVIPYDEFEQYKEKLPYYRNIVKEGRCRRTISACIRNAECNLQLFKKGMLKNIRPDKNEE